MGLFRPSRTRRGPDPYYDWKVVLFTAGAAVGLTGIFTNHDNLVLLAMPILAAGVILRWLPRRGDAQRPPEHEETEPELQESAPGDEAPAPPQRDSTPTLRESATAREGAPPRDERAHDGPPPDDERPEDGPPPQ